MKIGNWKLKITELIPNFRFLISSIILLGLLFVAPSVFATDTQLGGNLNATPFLKCPSVL